MLVTYRREKAILEHTVVGRVQAVDCKKLEISRTGARTDNWLDRVEERRAVEGGSPLGAEVDSSACTWSAGFLKSNWVTQ